VAFTAFDIEDFLPITPHHHDTPSINPTSMASTVAIGLGIAVTAFLVCCLPEFFLAGMSADLSGAEAAKWKGKTNIHCRDALASSPSEDLAAPLSDALSIRAGSSRQ
jgi:hypothetical protein